MKNIIITLIVFNVISVSSLSFSQTQPVFDKSDLDSNKLFLSVEEMPMFTGGKDAFVKYFNENLNYPKEEMKNEVSGTVYVKYKIDTLGKVKDAVIVKGVENGVGLDIEALRLIKSMPDWIPGKINGRPTNVILTYPIKFVLKNRN